MITLKSSAASSLWMTFSLGICLSAFAWGKTDWSVSSSLFARSNIYLHFKEWLFHRGVTQNCIIFTRPCKFPANAKEKLLLPLTSKYASHISLSSHPIFLTSGSNMTTQFTTAWNKSAPISICLQKGASLHLDASVHGQLWLFMVTNPLQLHAVVQPVEDFIDKYANNSGCWCFTGGHLLPLHPSPLWSPAGDPQINRVWGLANVSKYKIRSVCTCQPHEIWNGPILTHTGLTPGLTLP